MIEVGKGLLSAYKINPKPHVELKGDKDSYACYLLYATFGSYVAYDFL